MLHILTGLLVLAGLAVAAVAALFVLATLLHAWQLIAHQRNQRRAARTIARRERKRARKS